MNRHDFEAGFPGELVGTEVNVRQLRNGVSEVVAVKGLAFVPARLPPDIDWERLIGRLSTPLLAAHEAVARLDAATNRLRNPHLLLRPLLMQEAKVSSEIENTIATLEEVALDAVGVGFDRNEPALVGNYIRAIDHGLRSDYPFGVALMNEMHAVLLRNTGSERALPGQVRAEQNLIGRDGDRLDTARFVPPPAGPYLTDGLRNLFEFMNTPPEFLPKLIAIALAHYQFEAVHPYRDGNGRLGRLLITLAACRYRLMTQPAAYISGYFEEHRQEYYDRLLAVSQRGAWEDWLRFFLEAVVHQAQDALTRVEALESLREHYFRLATAPRMSAMCHTLIEHLFERQVWTVKDAQTLLGLSATAVRRHIELLVRIGAIEPFAGRSHPQLYIARQILRTAQGAAHA